MSDPYVKFDEIIFDTDERKQFCLLLYKQIREHEELSMRDEALYEHLKDINKDAAIASFVVYEVNKKALQAMKALFVYFTGVSSNKILLEDEQVDIFNPF